MTRCCMGLATNIARLEGGFEFHRATPDLFVVIGAGLSRREQAEKATRLHQLLDPFLPFGPKMGSLDAVSDAIAKNPQTWRDALAAVRGATELVVTATWRSKPDAGQEISLNNRQWLRRRATEQAALRTLQDEVWATVMRTASRIGLSLRMARRQPFLGGMDVALLIGRSQATAALNRFSFLERPGIALAATGPWPCFSFGPHIAPEPV